MEGMGSVEICVQLTQPQFDILNEMVYVLVTDDPNSIYIPADATLASKPSTIVCLTK